eukprot:6302284-Alexandrium_andersonii.AAC.1
MKKAGARRKDSVEIGRLIELRRATEKPEGSSFLLKPSGKQGKKSGKPIWRKGRRRLSRKPNLG